MTRETQRAHLLVLNGWKAQHAGSPQRGPQFEPTDQHESSIPKHPNSRYSVFYDPRRIPARAHAIRRSSQPPKSLAPRKNHRRILKTTSAKQRFHRSSGAFRLPLPKRFPELLARFSRTNAKNGHRTQAKRHFLHTRYHHFLKTGVRAPVSESAADIVFYDGS